MRRIGITTTIPSEVIWAAGMVPVDLNNLFITSRHRDRLIKAAERDGYPRNVCGWIKGIYGVLADEAGIDTVVAVTQGDCSNTHALMETLQLRGVRTIPFAYPWDRDPDLLRREISRLADELGTSVEEAGRMGEALEPLRRKLDRLDAMTWRENRVTGGENHRWLVSSSDFYGNYRAFEGELDAFLEVAAHRAPREQPVRLAYLGVPPILDDLYDVMEDYGAGVVLNEVQRQFSLPAREGGLIEQYRAYTYPYDVFHRLDFILPELVRRGVHGVIHYVQSFCHRQIEDIILRKRIPLPVLTIEGEQPGRVDERTKIRLQAFTELLGDQL